MGPRELLRGLPTDIRTRMPPGLEGFRAAPGSSLVQCWYGNRDIHYEAWIRSRLGVVEIGLHFEADPLTNARLFAAFRIRERSVRRALGAAVRIEEWDRGWARVWEAVELAAIDEELAGRVAGRLAAYIVALEPILRSELPADVPWSPS